ncbi:MAG: right-handed parallel beta-helix repeat-containing protein, partial [Armatimonadota bacterium]|nr:right-handed parallel beta-helix repeat-containing protein [Armatimonadota bacterium]
DTAGGDTNGNGSGSAPSPGDWWGIYLSPASGASLLNQCDLRYASAHNGGWGLEDIHGARRFATLYVDGCSPTITGCSFLNSQCHGLELWASNAIVQNNTFSNMGDGWYPIVYDTTDTFPAISGNTTAGTGRNMIALPGGTQSVSGTWQNPGSGFPYYLAENRTVAENTTLTIEPGNIVRVRAVRGLFVYGTLLADKATLEAESAYWLGIYLAPTAGASQLSECTLHRAGAYNGGWGLADIRGARRFAALYIDACPAKVLKNTFRDCECNAVAVWADASASPATIQENTIDGTGWDPIAYHHPDTFPIISGNTVTNPVLRNIWVPGGAQSGSGTWQNAGIDISYYVSDSRTVPAGQCLTIEKGVTVRIQAARSLWVEGTLTAEEVEFVPEPQDSRWLGIYLGPGAGGSRLHVCTIRGAGFYNGGWGMADLHGARRFAAVYIDQSAPILEGCTVIDSECNGIETWGAAPRVLSCVLSNCGWSPLLLNAGSSARVVNNTIVYGGAGNNTGVLLRASNPLLANNIIAYNATGILLRDGAKPVAHHNCLFGNSTSGDVPVDPARGDLASDPLLMDPLKGDYHLQAASPCRDAGENVVVPQDSTDADGLPRIRGTVDIGAYEYGGVLPVSLMQVLPTRVGNRGTATITIRGTGFL